MPTCDEGSNPYFEKVLQSIINQQGTKEIILVERGKTNQTENTASKFGIQVFSAMGKNRAQAMNIGLKHAKGHIILFHHPASILAPGALQEAEKVLGKNKSIVGGGFRFSFCERTFLLRYGAWYVNTIRSGMWKVWYLDQCPFVRTQVLRSIGGVPEVPVFEETLLFQKLRKRGKLSLVSHTVQTSAHKFLKNGILAHGLKNQWLKFLFFCGVSPRRLSKMYGRK